LWIPIAAPDYLAERASMEAAVQTEVAKLNESGEAVKGLTIDQLCGVVEHFKFDKKNPREFV